MSGRVNETAGTAGWATVDQVIRMLNEKLKKNKVQVPLVFFVVFSLLISSILNGI